MAWVIRNMADAQGNRNNRLSSPSSWHDWEERRILVQHINSSSSPRQRLAIGKLAAVLAATLLLAAVALLLRRGGGLQSSSTAPVHIRLAHIDQLVAAEQQVELPCPEYAYLKFIKVLHQNLGQQGPDKGDEGLVIEAMAMIDGDSYRVLTIINATSDYACNLNFKNGISGVLGVLYVTSGKDVSLRFSFKDGMTGKTLTIPKLALTFLGIDKAAGGGGVKSVSISDGTGYRSTGESAVIESKGVVKGKTVTMFSGTIERPLNVKPEDYYPQDPLHLTLEQKHRAVTIVYDQGQNVQVTLKVGKGVREKAFFYSTRPSIMCADTLLKGQNAPLPDLGYFPPLDKAVVAGEGELFEDWLVKDGELVEEGHVLFTTLKDQSPKKYVAQQEGKVTIQGRLKKGDNLGTRLSSRRFPAVVSTLTWPPLPRNLDPACDVVRGDPGWKFSVFIVDVGDQVYKDQEIVQLQGPDGAFKKLLAPRGGVVTQRQSKFKAGEPVERAADRGLMIIGKFPPLRKRFGEGASTVAQPDAKFLTWKAEVGAVVKRGDPVVQVSIPGHGALDVPATQDGKIKRRQEGLKPNMVLDQVMMDKNLAIVGKFDPLPVGTGDNTARVPPDMTFIKYVVKQNQSVEAGDTIAQVCAGCEAINGNANGPTMNVLSSRSGLVLHMYKDLRENMQLDSVLATLSLATIGKLRPLAISLEQEPVKATSKSDTFEEWHVKEGTVVQENDAVATVKNRLGSLVVLKSPKYGTVEATQPQNLEKGSIISEVMMDRTLAVIGKFPQMEAGWFETCVKAPDGAVFANWVVQDNQDIVQGQVIAKVMTDSGRRRLEALENDDAGEKIVTGFLMNVTSPMDGYMGRKNPLKMGMLIEEAQVGQVIATIRRPLPIMQILAIIICLIMWCCLFCLWKILKKPKPIYNHIIFDDPEEDPCEEMQKEHMPLREKPPPKLKREKTPPKLRTGVRLDFEDDGELRTVYAHYKPLGIKHDDQAPIVVRGFTVNSYAKVLHVQHGWKLVGIGEKTDEVDNDVRGKDIQEVNRLLYQHLKDLPLYALYLKFKTSMSSQDQVVVHKFTDYPLGLEFANESPIRITEVSKDGAAAKVDPPVQANWFIIQIGNKDVSKITDFKEVKEYLKEGLLPLAEHKQQQSQQRMSEVRSFDMPPGGPL